MGDFIKNFFTFHSTSNDRDRRLIFIWTIATESNWNEPDACAEHKTSSKNKSRTSKYEPKHAVNLDRLECKKLQPRLRTGNTKQSSEDCKHEYQRKATNIDRKSLLNITKKRTK